VDDKLKKRESRRKMRKAGRILRLLKLGAIVSPWQLKLRGRRKQQRERRRKIIFSRKWKGDLRKNGMKSERKRIVISVSEIWFLDLNYAERSCSDLRTLNSFH